MEDEFLDSYMEDRIGGGDVSEETQDDMGWEDWRDEGEDLDYPEDFDDSMDGDHESGLASAGFGTDEDYGDFGGNGDF